VRVKKEQKPTYEVLTGSNYREEKKGRERAFNIATNVSIANEKATGAVKQYQVLVRGNSVNPGGGTAKQTRRSSFVSKGNAAKLSMDTRKEQSPGTCTGMG